MTRRGEKDWEEDGTGRSRPRGLLPWALAGLASALEREAERWFLWVPVLFAGGILAYFALPSEPDSRIAVALLLAAIGLCLTMRDAPLGLALGGAVLAFALGFATAKLRTEMARAPVLTKELRYVAVEGWVEAYERRDKGRARIILRVIGVGELKPEETPYRIRVTLATKQVADAKTGDAVALKATLQPPPEP